MPITPETVEFIYFENGVVSEPRGKANGIDSFGNLYILFFSEETAFIIQGNNGVWSQPVEIANGNFGALAVDANDYIHIYINSEINAIEPYIAHYVSKNYGATFELEKQKIIKSQPGDSYLVDHFLIFSREVEKEKNIGIINIINLNYFDLCNWRCRMVAWWAKRSR